ncbi:hypothetical protein MANES_15G057800v8 [Manihot esculenta]|uniref:GBF-interacting protein 1 N-terminal domain-containing protein n=1 Tax=Manihot esculenta TaxID=3983 RepID=A0A2C9UDH3_MANES|nr:hypothetical protein MANES_15G057800v8 [Manihot esculenta]
MSSSGGGGGGGGGGGPARVTIPETVLKTIQSIREITGKQHSDEDIYSVLRDCSMDPNDTAQKLLYLDTFHEVKRKHEKRDRRKEMSSTQGRGARGGRGNNSANHAYSDAVGGRNASFRRENGVNHMKERRPSASLPVVHKTNSSAAVTGTKASTVSPNGPSSLSSGSSSPGLGQQSPESIVDFTKDSSDADVKKPESPLCLPGVPKATPNQVAEPVIQVQQGKPTSNLNDLPNPTISSSVSGVYSSESNPVLEPSMTQDPSAAGGIKQEVENQGRAAGQYHMQCNKLVSYDDPSELPKNETATSSIINSVYRNKLPGKLKAAEKELSETLQPSLSDRDNFLPVGHSSCYSNSSQESILPQTVVSSNDVQADDSSCLLPEQTVPNGHVTFPNHFKVPEALKTGLTFGSFDTNSGLGTEFGNSNGCGISGTHAIESSCGNDETAREPSSNQSISSTTQVDNSDQPESPQPSFEKVTNSEDSFVSTANSKSDKAMQETVLLPEGNQNPIVQIAPNYGLGIMPAMQGGHLLQFEGHEIQARDMSHLSGYVSENPTTSSSPSPTPPVQNSLAASPHQILFRPPYPPSYIPYGHYFNPYFLPPMHQFLSHNGLSQQLSTGNTFLTPAPGMKFPLPQFNPGTSTGNPAPIGIQPLYGAYASSPIGFNPASGVTSGCSDCNNDLSTSQLKESQNYTTGPLVGHGPFPGIYPPVQTIAAASTLNPLLQQSQAGSATVETVGLGHPSGAYQQTQLAQINWNSNY